MSVFLSLKFEIHAVYERKGMRRLFGIQPGIDKAGVPPPPKGWSVGVTGPPKGCTADRTHNTHTP